MIHYVCCVGHEILRVIEADLVMGTIAMSSYWKSQSYTCTIHAHLYLGTGLKGLCFQARKAYTT